MKIMTCKQLAGACNKEFHANTGEEMMELSKSHGMEMFQQGNKEHLKAMKKMQDLMQDPEALKKWFSDKKMEFKNLDASPL